MSRLTRRLDNGRVIAISPQAAIEKLAALEDAEENETLVLLPCKVGDTVYTINRKRIMELQITEVKLTISQFENTVYYSCSTSMRYCGFYGTQIGREIFLTRDAAEEALKERENE